MPSRYSTYDDYDYSNSYADARNSRRQSTQTRTKVVEVPDDRIAWIRQRELAAFYGEPEKSLVLRRDDSPDAIGNDEVSKSQQLVRTDTRSKSRTYDDYYRRSSTADRGRTSYDRQNGRRQSRATSEGGYGQRSNQDRQLRQTQTQTQSRGQSRDQYQYRNQQQDQNQQQYQQGQQQGLTSEQERQIKISMNKDKIEKGGLHHCLRERKDGNFLERNFDSSWDGVLAAGAGAAIGAITVRRLRPLAATEEQNKENSKKNKIKMIGGAALGAVAFNAGENWFRVWAEQHEEGGEAVNTCGELLGEGLDNFPIA